MAKTFSYSQGAETGTWPMNLTHTDDNTELNPTYLEGESGPLWGRPADLVSVYPSTWGYQRPQTLPHSQGHLLLSMAAVPPATITQRQLCHLPGRGCPAPGHRELLVPVTNHAQSLGAVHMCPRGREQGEMSGAVVPSLAWWRTPVIPAHRYEF